MRKALIAALILAAPAWRASAASLSPLTVRGANIVDRGGKVVHLHGINLGGWLVEEIWMMPFQPKPPEGSPLPEIKDHVSLMRVLTARFGADGARRVLTALRSNWITDADFDRIKALGFNCVRVPFLYDLLTEPDGLRWLDLACDRAEKRGLYVILDLHGAPGRQSGEHHTGEAGVDRLFKEEKYVAQTEEVWKTLARRYRGRPVVAAYDTMNEPTGAKDAKQLYDVQDRFYRAIRSVDPDKVVIVEDGYKGVRSLPAPRERGWTNVILSYHYYNFDAKSEEDHRTHWKREASQWAATLGTKSAPFYIGEMNLEPHGTAGTMQYILSDASARGWNWSPWTYKIMMPGGNSSMWGLYRNTKPVPALDPFRDTDAELIQKMAEVRTERLDRHTDLARAYIAASSWYKTMGANRACLVLVTIPGRASWAEEVYSTLRKNGIPYGGSSSLAVGLFVAPEDAARAWDLMKRLKDKHPELMLIADRPPEPR